MAQNSYTELPANLPVPQDDGAAAHLLGLTLPDLELPSTSGERVSLSRLAGTVVLYAYPMTGRPGVPLPPGWDSIPGARGCTPESCGFRDHHADLQRLGATVYGLSTQSTDYQREFHQRLQLPFAILSDEAFALTDALGLPTFHTSNMRLLKRLTLIARQGVIEKVFYPIFPPDAHAGEVLNYLKHRALPA